MKYCDFTLIVATIVYSVSNSEGNQNEVNINKYLFDENNFEFIDLTLSVFKSRFLKVEDVVITDQEWVQTSVNVGSKSESTPTDEFKSVKTIPMKKLILPLIIADISSKVGNDSNFELQKHHLDFFINNFFGIIEQPCLLIFKFGWPTATDGATPGVSKDVAKWITKAYKNIVGVGVDLPSLDPSSSTNYPAHNALVKAGLYVVENVNLEHYLPDAWCTAVLFPLSSFEAKAPARFGAICPKTRMQKQDIPWHRL